MLLFRDLDDKQLDRFLKILVQYLSLARPSEEFPDIMDVIRSLPAGGETMETIADMLEKRGEERGISLGEQRGKQRGKLEKSREMLLRSINNRFGTINRDIVERIKDVQSVEILDGLFDLSFRVDSLEEFKEQVHRATDN